MLAARVSREPPFAHTFFLLEEFLDAPQRRESHNGRQGTPKEAFDEKSRHCASHAHQQENPPRACAEIVFGLDNNGMEQADNQKRGQSQQRSLQRCRHKLSICLDAFSVSGNADGHGAVDFLLKRDERFSGYHSRDFLYAVVEQLHEVLIVV